VPNHIHQLYSPLLNSHCYGFELRFSERSFYTLMEFLLNAVLHIFLKVDTISNRVIMIFTCSLYPSV